MVSNESWHLYLHVESLNTIVSCIVLPYGGSELAYFARGNLPAFGTTIFENSSFLTNIDNMYIKWKLRTFWIQIWHKKYNLLWKKLHKKSFSKFSSHFLLHFFFRNSKFLKNFIYNPQIFYHPLVFKTQNGNYMQGWYTQLHPRQNDKPSKLPRVDSTPPRLFKG